MRKKFTLIELIIVIVVIGILAAMALPKFNGVVRNAKLSAMINDKEVLEKTMVLYYQKYDKLPILNENQELIVLDNDISLIKMVQAKNIISDDMKTIYTSLQETLKHYNDSEENLYRIDIKEINDNLSKKLKYGKKKEDKDFYVYSTKTNNVYYYNVMLNGDEEIYHSEFNTKLKESKLVDKRFSYILNEDGNIINNKPIVELTTDLSSITTDSLIKWEYIFTDEDTEPTKISFILNDVEYDNFDKIPTQLGEGEYVVKLKMQDSKGLWSDEINKRFKVNYSFKFQIETIKSVKNTINIFLSKENISNVKIIGEDNKIYYEGNSTNILINNLNYDTQYNLMAISYINNKEVKRVNFSIKTEKILNNKLEVRGSSTLFGYINTSGKYEKITTSNWGIENVSLYNTVGLDFKDKYAYIIIDTSTLPKYSRVRIRRFDDGTEIFYDKNQIINLKINLSTCVTQSNYKVLLKFDITQSSTGKVKISDIKIDY